MDMDTEKKHCDDCGGAIKYGASFSAKTVNGDDIAVCSDCYLRDGDYHDRWVAEQDDKKVRWEEAQEFVIKTLTRKEKAMTNNKITDEFFPEEDDGDEYYVDDSGFFPIRRRRRKMKDRDSDGDDDGNVVVII